MKFRILRVGERTREGNDLYREMSESKVLDKTMLVFGQMNEPPGARARVALSALTMAEHFRDVEGKDLLLFMDKLGKLKALGGANAEEIGKVEKEIKEKQEAFDRLEREGVEKEGELKKKLDEKNKLEGDKRDLEGEKENKEIERKYEEIIKEQKECEINQGNAFLKFIDSVKRAIFTKEVYRKKEEVFQIINGHKDFGKICDYLLGFIGKDKIFEGFTTEEKKGFEAYRRRSHDL